MKQPIYHWNEQTGCAICKIVDEEGREFIGMAMTHDADKDFQSEKTGQTIATYRALIKYLQSVRRDILRPQLAALRQLYYSMNRSKHYNKHSYEARMLWRQIKIKEEDIKTVTLEIDSYKKLLRNFIADKEQFYIATRKRRGQGENE